MDPTLILRGMGIALDAAGALGKWIAGLINGGDVAALEQLRANIDDPATLAALDEAIILAQRVKAETMLRPRTAEAARRELPPVE